MNEEEILKMEVGEELDKLVATEVMEEPIPEFTPPNALELQLAGSPVKSPKGSWLSRCSYYEGDIPTWRPLPYSTDISAAWQVVKKMITMNPNIWFHLDYSPINWWSANFERGGYGYEAKTQVDSEAICKAALLVKLAAR